MHSTATTADRGVYVTDGLHLFRIVTLLTPEGESGSAEIEDCFTLRTRAITAEELWELDLRPVR